MTESPPTEQALAIKALVKENEHLTKIKNRILERIESLHAYNVKMNHKVPSIELLEEEFKKLMT